MRRLTLAIGLVLAGCGPRSEELSSEPPSLHVGEVALHSGESGIAGSIASAQLGRHPGNVEALLLQSQAQAALGQTIAATAGFKQVLARKPDSVEAALGLARIIMPTDAAGAEALLAPIPLRGDATAAVWNNLGVARDLLGRHRDAQDAYRNALAKDPTMATAQVNLARSLSLTRTSPQ